MTAHEAMILFTGLTFIAAGIVLTETSRLLGPTFHTKVTVHIGWRILCFLAAAILFWRGVTYLFPGGLVVTRSMSAVAPAEAVVVAGLCWTILDWVMRDRAPPPYAERVLRWMVKRGASPQELTSAALALPQVTVASAPTCETSRCRHSRLTLMIGASLVVLAIVVLVAINSAPAS